MYYYTVNKIGDGSEQNPFKPDLPEGESFVGHEKDGEYIIAVTRELPVKAGRNIQLPRQALENAAKAKRLKYDNVTKWFVGE